MEPVPARTSEMASAGSPSPRDEILRKLRERIVGFAASKMGREDAEDIAQETLILLHEKYPQVERLDELLPLALRIVSFKVLALRRKSARRGEYTRLSIDDLQLTDGAADSAAAFERTEIRTRLLRAISQMGERCRNMFALKLEGKTFGEIQAILGAASINTVYAWDFRCRKQLLGLMGGSWEKER